jgi:aspartyl aminopeptidase
MEADLLKKSRVLAERFLEFVNRSITPFHVVHYCREKLL